MSNAYDILQGFKIKQNYPLPFNPLTIINYELPITNYVELNVYDLLGQKVVTLVSEKQAAGSYKVQWNAAGVASGIYFYYYRRIFPVDKISFITKIKWN